MKSSKCFIFFFLVLLTNRLLSQNDILWIGNSFSIRGTDDDFQGFYRADPEASKNPLRLTRNMEPGQSLFGHLDRFDHPENYPDDYLPKEDGTVAKVYHNYLPTLNDGKGAPINPYVPDPKLFNYVILQEHSEEPSSSYATYVGTRDKLSFGKWGSFYSSYVISGLDAIERTLAISPTSKAVLFQTWGKNPYNPEKWGELSEFDPDDTITTIDEAIAATQKMTLYNGLAAEGLRSIVSDPSRVLIARAGDAWSRVTDGFKNEELVNEMYASDGFHPRGQGSYTAAISIFETITGESIVGNPFLISPPDKTDPKYNEAFDFSVTREQADFLQKASTSFAQVPEPSDLLLLSSLLLALFYYKSSRKASLD